MNAEKRAKILGETIDQKAYSTTSTDDKFVS